MADSTVTCASCSAENPARAKFCLECGTRLPAHCGACGEEVVADARFCIGCGAPVVGAEGGGEPDAAAAKPADAAERRQLTVLFSDLVGSTALSEKLDPEDYRELIARYRNVVGEIVEKYGGHIANFVGDGVVALFGYPIARENSTYAAALSALEIADRAPYVAAGFANMSITTNVRVGLHTGPVVVGATATGALVEKLSLFGDTPNVAARIQSCAEAGQVVASAVARRLIGSQLEFQSIGSPRLAGVSAPIELFRVRRPKSAFDAVRRDFSGDAAPLIGRKAEIALVETRWDAAADSDGQVLVISGEAGIGKSRIVFALGRELADNGIRQLILFGSPLHKSSAFYSVRAALSGLLDLAPSDPPDAGRAKISAFLSELGLDAAVTAGPIGRLLGLQDQFDDAAAPSPEREKIAIIDTLLRICAAMERDRPLLLVLEDAHWIDASTLEFMSRWIDGLSGRRCLVLVTARPEFVSPWKNLAHVTSLELNRFGRRDTVKLIEQIAKEPPPRALVDQIVARTDGVPLFIEELTKMIVEAGLLVDGAAFEGDLSAAIPESLQDSLMARLDRLASVKEVAQVASAIGRTFSGEVLSRVQRRPEAEVSRALEQLVDADLVVPLDSAGEARAFKFRHALVQDAAYQSMLRSSRTRWHGRIAKVMEADFPEAAAREPEVVGYHYQRAGDHAAAERNWLAAARMAMSRSANVEAIAHLEAALDCLHRSPASEDRDRREMDLQIMIAVPLAFVQGYAHKSVLSAYDRARALCRKYGEVDRLFKVVYGQFRSFMLGGEYAASMENVELLKSLSQEVADPLTFAATERSLGSVMTYLGRPEEALAHLRAGASAELSRSARIRGLDFDVVDLAVALHGYLGLSGWLSGDTQGARRAIDAALEFSRETDHPFSVSFALAFAGWVFQFSGDEEAVRASSARLIALSEENTFQFWLGWGRVMNGWARRAELGEASLEMIGQGLDEWRGTGSRLGLSYFLYLYADAALALGKAEMAERLIGEAEAFEAQSGEAFWRIGLMRLRSRVSLVRGDRAGAEARLRQAVAIARKLGHRGPMLRAATDLARQASSDAARIEAATALEDALKRMAENDPASVAARDALKSLSEIRPG